MDLAAPPPSFVEAHASPAARVDVLFGTNFGVEAAAGLRGWPVWPTGLWTPLGWRLGLEPPSHEVRGFHLGWFGNVGATAPFFTSGTGATRPFVGVGARLTWAAETQFVTISPGVALEPLAAGWTLRDVALSNLGVATYGIMPPLVEIGWRPVPWFTVALRTAFPVLALRFET